VDPENGFLGVADFAPETPAGASFAAAELGRVKDPPTDSSPRATLIVTVAKGRWIFIASMPLATKLPQIPACAAEAAPLAEAPALPGGWGPFSGPEFEAWIRCERHTLPATTYFAQVKREAQQMSERLARVN
jgi:hypothetical protein